MNPLKKKAPEPKPTIDGSAVAVKRSDDPYLFEFELCSLTDGRIEADGRVSFKMEKMVGPYSLLAIAGQAYSYLTRTAFVQNSNAYNKDGSPK